MNKKMVKIIKIISIIFLAFALVTISVDSYALKRPNELEANTSTNGGVAVTGIGQSVMGILQTTGIIVSVIVLIILGIKYMMGSAEEKAEYKKTMIPYLVGAALIFGASVIANVVYQFFINMK